MVDLNDLEAGDSVLYGKSRAKCLVCKVDKLGAFRFLVVLFNTKTTAQTSYHYDLDGKNKHGGADIEEIIENPKRWTDEDLLNALGNGSSGKWDINNCEEWLDEYKESRNG